MAEPQDLTALLAHIERQARERDAALEAIGLATGGYPQLPALDDFRRLWSEQRTREQLRAALSPPPAGAGPLNSASLAHRALALMQSASPGYLQHLMGYLDGLSWLEQMQAAGKAARRRKPRS